MYTLLLLILVVLFLSGPVAAANPNMDFVLADNPIEPFFQDPDVVLNSICDLCATPFYRCFHAVSSSSSYMLARSLYNPARLYADPRRSPSNVEANLMLVSEYVTGLNQTQVVDEEVQFIAPGDTIVQEETVQAHVEDIYTPGDRMKPKRCHRSSLVRRQAPRPGGFGCDVDGCDKTFDRACDLHRHQRNTHLDRSKRPHKCDDCNEGFLYPKDLQRHQRKHIQQPSAQVNFFCRLPGCHSNPFTRRDNMLRHQRNKHPSIDARNFG